MTATKLQPSTTPADRSKLVSWQDPAELRAATAGRSGREFLQAIIAGELPPPPMAALVGAELLAVGDGEALFSCTPDESTYNPMGIVHGGLLCTLLDTAAGCAVHSLLPAGAGFSSIELKVSFLAPLQAGDRIEVRGRVLRIGGRVAFAEAHARDTAASSSATPRPRSRSARPITHHKSNERNDLMSTTNTNGTPIEGAVALVTGGNRGFGRALVDELLERGAAKVYATSRSAHPQRDDDRIVPLILDVTDDTSVAAAAQTATDVSILVNNAGHQSHHAGTRGAAVRDPRRTRDQPVRDHPRRARLRASPRRPTPKLDGQRALGTVVGLVRPRL